VIVHTVVVLVDRSQIGVTAMRFGPRSSTVSPSSPSTVAASLRQCLAEEMGKKGFILGLPNQGSVLIIFHISSTEFSLADALKSYELHPVDGADKYLHWLGTNIKDLV
jgi:hypothetical protein